jgi:hypothetical protein
MIFVFFKILLVLYVFNTFFIKKYIIERAQYFVLHFFFNMWICYVTYQEALLCFWNPFKSFEVEYSEIAILTTTAIASFHTYHILDKYQTLSLEDWIHHLLSSFIIPIIANNNPFGKIVSLSNFVMCGLPGGLDYLLLALVKYNWIDKLTEKRINNWLNLLIRMPIQMLSFYILAINYHHNKIEWDYYMFSATFLHTLNSIYYCNKVVGNRHVSYYKEKINKK